MFTYWRRVCRHGAVTRGPQTRVGGFYFPLAAVRVRMHMRVYARARVGASRETWVCGGGRRVVKQVAPKPRAVGCSCQILRLL